MSLKSFFCRINLWFFGMHSTWGLSVFRILLGLLLILKFVLLYVDLELWYTEYGVLDLASAVKLVGEGRINLFLLFQDYFSGNVALVMWGAALTFATTFCLGLWTRTSAFFLYILLVSFDHRNILVLHGADTLYRVVLFWMIFARSNAHYSIDAIIAKFKSQVVPTQSAAWPLRALQIQVATVYLATFWAKSEGATWWDGSAVYIVSQLIEFKRFPLPFLYSSWITIKLASWYTLAFEGGFAMLIWFRETRLWILGAGIVLHLGIDWHLQIPLFQWLAIATYAVFLEQDDFVRFRKKFRTPS